VLCVEVEVYVHVYHMFYVCQPRAPIMFCDNEAVKVRSK
jgi:hypothetical protein